MAAGKGNQDIQTPDALARLIVNHFMPSGKICEPCKGNGAFIRALEGKDVAWYEIKEGRDWLTAEGHWDWIITNPPWNSVRKFLTKAMECSDNIVFLCWAASWWTKRRTKMIREAGFGIVEILLVPTPPTWPPTGFALSATWVRRGWDGGIKISNIPASGECFLFRDINTAVEFSGVSGYSGYVLENNA